MKLKLLSFLLLVAIGEYFSCPAAAADNGHVPFRVLEQWKLGGAGGWGPLLFDSSSNALYIPRTDRVVVLDAGTGQVRGEIPGFLDARNVALDDMGKYGYVTDIADGTVGYVRVFDRKTLALVKQITVGRIPGAIVFDPATKTVFAFSSRDRNAAVIDTKTNSIVATVALPGKPHLAVGDGKGSVYVSFRGIGKLARIDAASRTATSVWSTAPCDEFHGMAMDAARRQVLASCYDRRLVSIDADSGKLAPIGQCPVDSSDLAFDPQRGLLINATSHGVLTILQQESTLEYKQLQELASSPRAGTITVDPGSGRVFLVTAAFEQRPVSGKGMEEMQSRLIPVPGSFEVIVAGP